MSRGPAKINGHWKLPFIVLWGYLTARSLFNLLWLRTFGWILHVFEDGCHLNGKILSDSQLVRSDNEKLSSPKLNREQSRTIGDNRRCIPIWGMLIKPSWASSDNHVRKSLHIDIVLPNSGVDFLTLCPWKNGHRKGIISVNYAINLSGS
jgi:hypothetical protein